MTGDTSKARTIITAMLLLWSIAVVAATPEDSLLHARRFVHRFGAEFRSEYIAPTNPFLGGVNSAHKPIDLSLSAHLRYSWQPIAGSPTNQIYKGVYQGIGVSYYNFGSPQEIGNPVAIYLFQGARLARLSPRLTFNYEWNFGLSAGWKPYHPNENQYNGMTGSRLNALLNVDFYLLWHLSQHLDLTAGLAMTHFSNGNTTFPNAGLNSIGAKLGVTYNFGRTDNFAAIPHRTLTEPFPRHVSYDVVAFGSWRRTGATLGNKQYASPDAYTVLGLSVAAMYNFGYRFRAGVGVDGIYDSSANVYTEDVICELGSTCPDLTFYKAPLREQLAMGLSARAEFVMPYFTVGIGLGANLLHRGGDMKQFYQMLTLKIAVTRSSFIHIGYNLKDFHLPNYLMLGVGYRFNNKYPRLH